MSWDPENGIYMDAHYNLHYREVKFPYFLEIVIMLATTGGHLQADWWLVE